MLAAGFYVIFFAGLSWKVSAAGRRCVVGPWCRAALPPWSLVDAARLPAQAHLTLLDPTTDPLGKGFHIIQSTIAIGSGGVSGKGWHEGTQAHLEFIPERTTDFIFAVYLRGVRPDRQPAACARYLLLIGRGLMIAANAPTSSRACWPAPSR